MFTICCWLVKAQVFSANNEKKWFQSFSDVVGYMNFIIIFFCYSNDNDEEQIKLLGYGTTVCVCVLQRCSIGFDLPNALLFVVTTVSIVIIRRYRISVRQMTSPTDCLSPGTVELYIYDRKNTHSIHLLLCIWLRRFRACNCIRPFRFIRFCQSNYRRSTKKK